MKSIVFLTLAYHPAIGGAEKQAQFLAEKWASEGQSVLILTRRLSGTPHREVLNGVTIVRLPSLWVPGLSWVSFSAAALIYLVPKLHHISCFIAFMVNAALLPGALLSRIFGIPLIVRPSAGGPGGNIQTLRRSVFGSAKLSFLLGAATYVTAINKQIWDEAIEAGVPSARIRLIPNGADTRHFRPNAPMSATKGPTVLFVGRLEKVKNLDGLLSSWSNVMKEIPLVQLVLVGDGAERAAIEKQIQDLHLSSSVRLEGSQENVLPYYQNADVFILPSHREGLSNALLEAMSCGVVPVATGVGGSRAILEKLSPDLLLRPGAPQEWPGVIVPLLKDAERRKRLAEQSRALIEKQYSSWNVAAQYETLLKGFERKSRGLPFPILAYHRVLPTPQYGIDIRTTEFEAQLRWLSRHGYKSIHLADFELLWREGRPWPEKTCIITFDDGHAEFFEHAVPLLKKYGLSATLFINTGLLGKKYWVSGRRPHPVRWNETPPPDFRSDDSESRVYTFMNWDQVQSIQRDGFEIASHGVLHPFLTDLSDADLKNELTDSKTMIQSRLSIETPYFCYPSGNFDARVQYAVQEAGYRGAVQTPGHDLLFSQWDNPYTWERIGVWQDVRFWKFKGLVKGWYPKLYRSVPRGIWAIARGLYRGLFCVGPQTQKRMNERQIATADRDPQ